jgi:hypothetical protein
MRFSLRNLFLFIALLAIACAGLMYRSPWWLKGITALTLMLFVVAALMALAQHGRGRAVLFGFCIVGLLYFFLSINDSTGKRLPTTDALAAGARALKLGAPSQTDDPFGDTIYPDPSKTSLEVYTRLFYRSDSDEVAIFAHIGHCIFALFFATLAAWFVGRMYDRHNLSEGVPR